MRLDCLASRQEGCQRMRCSGGLLLAVAPQLQIDPEAGHFAEARLPGEQARGLPEDEVLELLRGSSQTLLLAFLQHLVSVQGTSREELHTELALVLSQAALDLLPASAEGGEPSAASTSGIVLSGFSKRRSIMRIVTYGMMSGIACQTTPVYSLYLQLSDETLTMSGLIICTTMRSFCCFWDASGNRSSEFNCKSWILQQDLAPIFHRSPTGLEVVCCALHSDAGLDLTQGLSLTYDAKACSRMLDSWHAGDQHEQCMP